MSLLAALSEAQLRAATPPDQFARVETLVATGQVQQRQQIGRQALAAQVSDGNQRHRSLFFIEDGHNYTHCTCAASTHGLCPHVLAMLLAWLRDPASFTPAPSESHPTLAATARTRPRSANRQNGVLPKESGFQQHLKTLTQDELRKLVDRYKLPVGSQRRELLYTAVSQALSNPATIRAAIRALTPEMRRMLVLFELHDHGDGLPAYQINHHAEHLGFQLLSIHPGRVLDSLGEVGLVARAYDHYALLQAARPLLPPDTSLLPRYAGLAPTGDIPASRPTELLRLLTHTLVLAQTGLLQAARPNRPPTAPAGRGKRLPPAPNPLTIDLLTSESLARLMQATHAPRAQLDYVLRLLGDLDILNFTPGQPVFVNTVAWERFAHLPALQQLRTLFDRTHQRTRWTELILAGEMASDRIVLQPGASANAIEALQSFLTQNRGFHINLLRQAPTGIWLDMKAYVSLAWRLNTIGPGAERRRSRRNARSQEEEIHHAVTHALFVGPWSWLGLIDLLPGPTSEPVAFRLTELGEYYLQRRTSAPALPHDDAPARALRYTPNGDIALNPAALHAATLDLLSTLGEPLLNDNGELHYRPTPSGAAACFSRGLTPVAILRQLSHQTENEPPVALTSQLMHWYDRYNQVQLYPELALIALADDYALAELLATTTLPQHLIYKFNPRLIAVDPSAIDDLIAEFTVRGYAPKQMDDNP